MKRIIVVDLDGTLIKTDMLIESLFVLLRKSPRQFPKVFAWALRGKAFLKRKLADFTESDFNSQPLPFNQQLIDWLKDQRQSGAELVLATATDLRIANAIAKRLNIFDSVLGTDGINLSADNKRQALENRFGKNRFEYVGNSKDDLRVWNSAAAVHIVDPEIGVLRKAKALKPIDTVLNSRPSYFPTLFKQLRLHQWIKNLLIFVPLFSSHRILEWPLILSGLVAFFAFGFCASAVYLLNDLIDLPDDRNHDSKCFRPLASGDLPIVHALLLIPTLLLASVFLAVWMLPSDFILVLTAYFVLTTAYTLWLKRIVMLDVITLSMLYTLRVIAGTAAMGLVATFWILAFCMFIFLSLAFVKRYTELLGANSLPSGQKVSGRDYCRGDLELIASLGGASGYLAVLVLVLYINEETSGELYRSPEWMWLAAPLLLFWISRVWILAHRGQMHDDPVVFALRDNVSRWIGVGFIVCFVMASL